MPDRRPGGRPRGASEAELRAGSPPTPPSGRRALFVGGQGRLVLGASPDGAAMSYWNADGRPAALCVNGTRCAARLALELGWGDDRLVVETGALRQQRLAVEVQPALERLALAPEPRRG